MNIYFSGIGGVGVGPLAEIARDAGHQVIGSDVVDTLVTEELRAEGIGVNIGQDGSFLQAEHSEQPIDWFVYTSALPAGHPELELAKKLGIKIAKRDELLAQIIKEKNLKLIAVSGTHGKTTTTGMLIWVFKQLKIPVSYSIGTTISFGPSGFFDPASDYFVYECDEFDHNLLHFYPYLALISAVDYDHPDTYANQQDYFDAFRQFASQSQTVIAWADQHSEIFDGLDAVNLCEPSDVDHTLTLKGEQNRRNGTLVEKSMQQLRFDGDFPAILDQFPGTDRRFEKLADNLYSDYGHHPIEIAATLAMARELSDHVVLVYQPHQNIRQHQIKNEYVDQFELADDVYWLPTYLSREDPNLPILEPAELIKNITNAESIHIADFNDELWNAIQKARAEGKLVLGMGAGAIDGWLRLRLAQAVV